MVPLAPPSGISLFSARHQRLSECSWCTKLTQVLGCGQGIVFVEQCPNVGVIVLFTPGSNDTDTTSGNVPKPDMETSKFGTDDKEHAKRSLGVLNLGEERRVETEREGDLGRLVKVALDHLPVENQQCFENLDGVLVGCGLADEGVQVFVREGLFSLKTLERKGRSELGSFIGDRVCLLC